MLISNHTTLGQYFLFLLKLIMSDNVKDFCDPLKPILNHITLVKCRLYYSHSCSLNLRLEIGKGPIIWYFLYYSISGSLNPGNLGQFVVGIESVKARSIVVNAHVTMCLFLLDVTACFTTHSRISFCYDISTHVTNLRSQVFSICIYWAWEKKQCIVNALFFFHIPQFFS